MSLTADPLIVADLGGTWWRTAILTDSDELVEIRRERAVTRNSTRSHPSTLRALMVRFLLDRVHALRAICPEARQVGISIGAAVDARSNLVLASAPLWGDYTEPWNLLAELRSAEPDLEWTLLQDLTALALAARADTDAKAGWRCVSVVTVSSGIGARTIDLATGEFDWDSRGLQGEIGHLPVPTRTPPAVCDCGTIGHLAAYASGRALERDLAASAAALGVAPRTTWLSSLRAALDSENEAATAFLDAHTAPLAATLLAMAVIDPRVDHIYLSGGVVDTLDSHYSASISRGLDEGGGLYLASNHPQGRLDSMIDRLPGDDGTLPLRGAGLAARADRNERR
ncbi:ROK family protein [Nocardia sp. NPDC050435]|uniref:ROK family protein n=1 Tax=Nocardia sp. NPDC050435 TaxID=3155040 RepID=UPI0034024E23